ncbi:MAG: acyl carrier protein [Thermodesulfobacteriota bacterium]
MKSQDSIVNELVDIIAEIAEVEPSEIGPKTHFINDLDMDSISSLEIVALLEKRYGIKITEDELPSLATMTGLIELISNHFDQ